MPVVRNGVETYHGTRLVVEQRDAGLVQEQLRRRGFASHEADSSDALGLTLLELPEFDSAIVMLRQNSGLVQAAIQAQPAAGSDPAPTTVGDLDLLLFAVRQLTREDYDGWVPAMDKDQILGQIDGLPYIKGAIGIPDKAPAPLSIPPVTRQAGPRIGILDTELYAHPDLIGRFEGHTGEFGPEPPDTQGHATFVAGLIVQRAPTVELVVRTALHADGQNASSWDVAKKMAGFMDAGVAVLNLSLGCATADRVAPLSLRRAVDRLVPSVVLIAAAGNNGVPGVLAQAKGLRASTPIYPAAIDGVIGVGAYDSRDGGRQAATFSPAGVPWVQLSAPGVRVQSTFLSGQVRRLVRDDAGQLVPAPEGPADFGQPGYAVWDGTSFAAANVSGAIAALMAAQQVSAGDALGQLLEQKDPASDIIAGTLTA